jgi:hypothetical protein
VEVQSVLASASDFEAASGQGWLFKLNHLFMLFKLLKFGVPLIIVGLVAMGVAVSVVSLII